MLAAVRRDIKLVASLTLRLRMPDDDDVVLRAAAGGGGAGRGGVDTAEDEEEEEEEQRGRLEFLREPPPIGTLRRVPPRVQ